MKTCQYKNCKKLTKTKFCSKSCAAKHNNSIFKKRTKTKICKTNNCNNLILSKNVYCPDCIAKGFHLRGGNHLANKSIKDIVNYSGSNKYGAIRCHARLVVKNRKQICKICGYDKHVEVCHIKDISKFSESTLIKTVNNPNNLILLCPNCHWEFDNGLLMVGEVGFEPTTPNL